MGEENLNNLIQDCFGCKTDDLISEYILFKKPSSFYGSKSPKIMLLGHSPTVRTTKEASVVLKMDKPQQPLYKYITNNILEPLGISISELYCTNIIKCQTKCLPEDILSPIKFFDRAFLECRTLLEKEVEIIKPDLIISLSETVLKLISKTYMEKELKMKESFGRIFGIEISGLSIPYIPVVHIPKGTKSKVAMYYFPEQTNRLIEIKNNGFLMNN